ncbi:serine O-acetyltransferase [Frondihabitans peucedani]|uniref:Serine acetyltransferase n=1 Tax=Frondihabitans peucedani TaxID=598626 RepID=A0ABP8E0Q5_9MICO
MRLIARLRDDVRAVRAGDPAARGSVEIVLVYSGLHAVWAYRLTSRLWRTRPFPGARVVARVLSQLARSLTGIEIHPGATIGRRLFIDHGMGVVIGETAVVGDDVLLYHGVTLGGRGAGPAGRRHPSVGDRVVIGAGAAVLGPVTVGDDASVGAGAVVTHDVSPGDTVVGVPARPL